MIALTTIDAIAGALNLRLPPEKSRGQSRSRTRDADGGWPDILVEAKDLNHSPKPLFGLQAKPGLGAMALSPFLATV